MKRFGIFLMLIGILVMRVTSAYAQTPTPLVPVITTDSTPTLACANAPRTRLILQERARVAIEDLSPLNVRDGVGTNADVLAQLIPGDIFFVLDGPQCSQRYAWYFIEYKGIQGWIAEGDNSLYFAEVYPPE